MHDLYVCVCVCVITCCCELYHKLTALCVLRHNHTHTHTLMHTHTHTSRYAFPLQPFTVTCCLPLLSNQFRCCTVTRYCDMHALATKW